MLIQTADGEILWAPFSSLSIHSYASPFETRANEVEGLTASFTKICFETPFNLSEDEVNQIFVE